VTKKRIIKRRVTERLITILKVEKTSFNMILISLLNRITEAKIKVDPQIMREEDNIQ
jgi:hypothetical protein